MKVITLPTVTYNGPLPTLRVGWGMLIRGQPQDVSQETLDIFHTQLNGLTVSGNDNAPEPETVDLGNDGLPDSGWRRVDIIDWLKVNKVHTRAGLTKAQLLERADEFLNPVEVTEENNSDDGIGGVEEELSEE